MPSLKRMFDVAARRTVVGGQTLLATLQDAANNPTNPFASQLVGEVAGESAAALADINGVLDDLDGTAPEDDIDTAAALALEKTDTAIDGVATDVQQTELSGPAPTQLVTAFEFVAAWLEPAGDGRVLLEQINDSLTNAAAPAGFLTALNNIANTLIPSAEGDIDELDGGVADAILNRLTVINNTRETIADALVEALLYPQVAVTPLNGGTWSDPTILTEILNQGGWALDGFGVDAGTVAAFRTRTGITTLGGGYPGDEVNDPLWELLDFMATNLPV